MTGLARTAMRNSDLDARLSAVDRTGRRGGILPVLLVGLALIAAIAGLVVVGRDYAETYKLSVLAVFGVIGVFSLFAIAAGILRLTTDDGASPTLTALVDDAVDGILVTDGRNRVIYANAAYRALVGATGAGVRPVERAFVGDPDVSEAVYRLLRAARDRRRHQEEVRIPALAPGQPARWLRLRVRPLAEQGPDSRKTAWTVADVTRDRERQENVFQELQQAIDYLDHAPAGFFSADGTGAVAYINATLANWLNYDLTEIGAGGLKLADIVSGSGAALLTSFAAEPGDVKSEIFDLDLKTSDGRTWPARLYHKVAFAADGTPGASRTLVLDRTRDSQGDPNRAAEVRFMRFFQNTPMAIATVDKNGRIVRANGLFARLQQSVHKNDGAERRTILSVVADRDRPAVEAAIARAAGGQGDLPPVDVALGGDGERWGQFYITPVEDVEQDSEAAIVYTLDTTERRALEEQRNRAQKLDQVGRFAGGIAHDFNNVLSAIMMAADFLLNAHKPTDPSFADIIQIKQNANRAAALVRQLLAFSRRQTMRPQVLDLSEALSDIEMLLRRTVGEKIKLEIVHARDLWPVKADLSQFEQVIMNLVVNARDAMPDGGRLTIDTANIAAEASRNLPYREMPAADYVSVEVTDSGSGIPAEIADKIFEPFFTTKEVGKGTGLGLSVVYGIIKQSGGFIYVDSEMGRGTTFRIFLPRHVLQPDEAKEKDQAAGQAATEQKPAVDDTGQGTILLVEDEEGLRGLNARGLASRGYTVLEASNGIEAIEVLERHDGRVDLVVSDVVMPEMDGPTLLKELRSRDPSVRIIFVSGYAEDAFARNLPEDQQFAFLPKPFTLKQLIAAVKETTG
jgi:two-component system cell cycle sensor histidine kinase/response regulator CckA